MSLRTEMSWSVAGTAAPKREVEGRAARVVLLGRWDGQLASEHAREPHERAVRPVALTLENFDALMAQCVPVVHTAVGPVSPQGFEAMHPDDLVQHVPLLQQLMALRRQLRDPAQFEGAARIVRAWQGAPSAGAVHPTPNTSAASAAALPTASNAASDVDDIERLLGRPHSPPAPANAAANVATPASANAAALVLDQWVARMVSPSLAPQAPAQSEALIEVVNQALAAALTALLHDARWQAFESLWRGADWLMRRLDTDQLAAITLVDLSWAELAQDLAAGRVSPALATALKDSGDEEAPVLTHVLVHEGIHLDELSMAAVGALVEQIKPSGAQLLACPKLQQFFDRQGAFLPQTQAAWDACLAAAGTALQMLAPRFVLRQPYGPGSDPLSWLAYREPLTRADGDAMLWGHPAWLVLADTLGGGDGVVADLPHVVMDDQDGAGSRLLVTEWPLNATLAELLRQFGVRAVLAHASRAAVRLC
jgi:type VI secretion system protein ImpC